MDNISRALAIAGGMLFVMFLVSLLLYAWTAFSEYQASQDELERVKNVAKFNQQYTNYDRDDVQGYELLSLVNKVIDYNQRYSSVFNVSNVAGNIDQYKPFHLEISLINEAGDDKRDDLTTTMNVLVGVGTTDSYNGASLAHPHKRLFEHTTYTQSNTINKFKDILDKIRDIENYFGGSTSTQNLVKSKHTYFESNVIGYNGPPYPPYVGDWYQAEYIINKYQELTGNTLSGGTSNAKLDSLRSNPAPDYKIIKILNYYEYMEFKKQVFKCTSVEYDEYTGRVTKMKFKIN